MKRFLVLVAASLAALVFFAPSASAEVSSTNPGGQALPPQAVSAFSSVGILPGPIRLRSLLS